MSILSSEEFARVSDRVRTGQTQLSIPRLVARQFFTHVSGAAVRITTGERLGLKKLLVILGLILSPTALVACWAIVVLEFGWFAAVVVPLIGVFWTVLAGFTSPTGGPLTITCAWAAAAVGYLVLPFEFGAPLLLFAMSLWIHRMTYILAQRWLTQLVVRSYPAYEMLAEHVEIEEAGADAGY